MTLFSQEVITFLFSSKYAGSAPAFALLMIALHLKLLVRVLGYTLTAAGHPGRSLAVDVARTVVSAAGALLLIPSLGVAGAALAAVMGGYASAPVAAWLVRRRRFSLAVAPYAKQTLILVLCGALGWWVGSTGSAAAPLYKFALITVFIALNLLCSTISGEDLRLLVTHRTGRLNTAAKEQSLPT